MSTLERRQDHAPSSTLKLTLCASTDEADALRQAGLRSVRVIDESHSVFRQDADGWSLDPALAAFGQFVLALPTTHADLRDELAIRLGDIRCRWVQWPNGCGDAADVLRKHGPERLATIVAASRPMWTDEVCLLSDVPDSAPSKGYVTGFRKLDEHGFRLIRPAFFPVVGPYASGKSVLIRQLVCNLYRLHGWRTLITAFEEKIKPRYVRDLRRHLIGREEIDVFGEVQWHPIHPNEFTPEIVAKADATIEDAFRFLRRKRNGTMDADRLIDRIEYGVRVYGVDVVVIDPVNEIDHRVPPGVNKTDYLGEFMMRLKALADDYNLLMIVLAHPSKGNVEKRQNGRLLTLNDAADTANYGNKADLGWCVWRPTMAPDCPTFLNMDKIKDTEVCGDPTAAKLILDKGMGRFNVVETGFHIFDEAD